MGSGIKMSKWTKQAERFIERHQEELRSKDLALFVSAESWPVEVRKGNVEKKDKAYRTYLVEKTEEYSLRPVSMELFGGIIDFDKMGWVTRKLLGGVKKDLEQAGFMEDGKAYDTRDMEEIGRWAEQLAERLKGR